MNELTEKKSKTITKSEHKLYTYSLFDISPESAFDMNEDEMLEEADRMQKDDIDMLVDAINTTNETKSIGMETIEKLDRQNEQLDNAIDDTRKIQEDLKIAAREMRIITTKITTDKLISIGIIILTVAAVAIVVVMIVLPKGKEIVETFT